MLIVLKKDFHLEIRVVEVEVVSKKLVLDILSSHLTVSFHYAKQRNISQSKSYLTENFSN